MASVQLDKADLQKIASELVPVIIRQVFLSGEMHDLLDSAARRAVEFAQSKENAVRLDKQIYTHAEVAKILGCSSRALARARQRGTIRGIRKASNRYVYDRHEIARHLGGLFPR